MLFTIMLSMMFTGRKRKYMLFTIMLSMMFTAQSTTSSRPHGVCVIRPSSLTARTGTSSVSSVEQKTPIVNIMIYQQNTAMIRLNGFV